MKPASVHLALDISLRVADTVRAHFVALQRLGAHVLEVDYSNVLVADTSKAVLPFVQYTQKTTFSKGPKQ